MNHWNLRNYELFAHRGYYGNSTIAGFEKCAEKGYYVETDIVQTADGTVFMAHDRSTTDASGNAVYVKDMTDAEFRTYWPNAPTSDEFVSFMLEYPEMLASVSAYQGLDAFLAQIATAGVDDRIIFDAATITSDILRMYPKVSWIINYVDGMTDADLDKYRTPYNIVSIQEREDNSDGEFHVSRQWSDVTVNTIADLVDKGHTWFCSSCNESALDALAEALAEYTPPNYSQTSMLTEIADAIRSKNGSEGEIVARNFPSQIRKLKTASDAEPASELNWAYMGATSSLIAQFKGHFPEIAVLNIDMADGAVGIPNPTYAMFHTAGCTININNCASATLSSDFCRQTNNVKEINFDGVYPTTLTRFLYQLNSGNFGQDSFWTDEVKVTGIYLDNLTTVNSGISQSNTKCQVNVVWEGTLKNSIDVTGKLTADSVNRLISCLADYSEGESHTLTLGSTLLALVTEESQAIATARNWTLA